jgi:hypothetical protein
MTSDAAIGAVDFEEKALLAEACQKTGLGSFGDESFRAPMRLLLEDLDQRSGMNAVGRAILRNRILEILVTRLRVEDWIDRHPEILDEPIERPVIIVGLARTGTTMLHRVLSQDPGWLAPLWYEVRFPAPFPGTVWGKTDPRIDAGRAEVRATLEAVPELLSIHPWDAVAADEEIMLLEQAFYSNVPESSCPTPRYSAFMDEADQTPGYVYLKRLLQFLQWQKRQAGERGDRWVLKTPHHLGYMDTLFRVFPDAKVIQTHRDPLDTIPSTASMYRALWALHRDHVDPVAVGDLVLHRYGRGLRRCMQVRDAMPADRFLDVWYLDAVRDPMSQVRRIYPFVGRELTPEAETRMQAWARENSRDKRAPHAYRMEDFGYTRERIERAFAEYRARYIEPRSSR